MPPTATIDFSNELQHFNGPEMNAVDTTDQKDQEVDFGHKESLEEDDFDYQYESEESSYEIECYSDDGDDWNDIFSSNSPGEYHRGNISNNQQPTPARLTSDGNRATTTSFTPWCVTEAQIRQNVLQGTNENFQDKKSKWISSLQRRGRGSHVLSPDEVRIVMNEESKKTSEILGIPLLASKILLSNYKWDQERLLESYWGDNKEIQRQCGVYYHCNTDRNETKCDPTDEGGCCLICFDPMVTNGSSFSLGCNHFFCFDCWKNYCKVALDNDGLARAFKTTCPFAGCTEVVTEQDLATIDPSLLPKFRDCQINQFVSSNPSCTKWCNGKSCQNVAMTDDPKFYSSLIEADQAQHRQKKPRIQPYMLSLWFQKMHIESKSIELGYDMSGMCHYGETANCDSCFSSTCMKCGSEAHDPCSCEMMVEWDKKCSNDDSETANWIALNTKDCPRCHVQIEKNDGCHHMCCQNCQYEFCWICRGNWKFGSHHFEACTRKMDRLANDKRNQKKTQDLIHAKEQLERYLRHYHKYQDYHELQKTATDHLQALVDAHEQQTCRLKHLSSYFNNEARKAVRDLEYRIAGYIQLLECFRVLKYSYIFAYFQWKNCNEQLGRIVPWSSEYIIKCKRQKDYLECQQDLLKSFAKNLKSFVSSTQVDAAERESDTAKDPSEEFANYHWSLQRYHHEYSPTPENEPTFSEPNVAFKKKYSLDEDQQQDIVNQIGVISNFIRNVVKYAKEEILEEDD